MTAWLDENCGANSWAMTPSGVRGVLNDAVSIYFLDPNGIRLEACCEPEAGEKPAVIASVSQARAEALKELESIERDWAARTVAAGRFK